MARRRLASHTPVGGAHHEEELEYSMVARTPVGGADHEEELAVARTPVGGADHEEEEVEEEDIEGQDPALGQW